MHGYGKNHEDFYEKPRTLSEEKKEKKEIQYCSNNVEIESPVMRPTVPSRKNIDFEIKEQNVTPDNIVSNAEISAKTTDEASEVSVPDRIVSAVCNSTEYLENENSEMVDDPSAVPEETQTENSGCPEQPNNIAVLNENGSEEEDKMAKGENEILFYMQKSLDKDI
jgi:hypothetical protein